MTYNKSPNLHDAWREEVERFEWNYADFEIAQCANLADELELFNIEANEDEEFLNKIEEWNGFVMDYKLWLAIEQCCYQSVLLPMGQRELRVSTCPPDMLCHLSYFFSRCPAHVKHHLALSYWVVVRVDRARRTGNPDWGPETATPRTPFHDTVFFHPPKLQFPNYAR
jgi:hypothetical protein